MTSVGLLDESETVRRYRHILRAASQDWAETAHRHALLRLGPDGRRSVLAEVRRLLVTATRLSQDDVHAIARLLVMAERRAPRVLLDGMPPGLLERLAAAVVDSPVGRMLRAGYDVWDGAEPPRPPEPPCPRTNTVAGSRSTGRCGSTRAASSGAEAFGRRPWWHRRGTISLTMVGPTARMETR